MRSVEGAQGGVRGREGARGGVEVGRSVGMVVGAACARKKIGRNEIGPDSCAGSRAVVRSVSGMCVRGEEGRCRARVGASGGGEAGAVT